MLRQLILSTLSSALLLSVVAVSPAYAQEQQDQPALPDIAPREIEIRGTLEISLPSLERQPLSGFNPPPRIPDIPANRMPYVGSYTPDRSDLPQPTPDPPQLQVQLDQPAPPLNGELEAGGGRYFSRFATGSLWLPLSTQESITIDGDYRGSAGFEPFDDQPDVESPFDTFTGDIGFQSRRDAVSIDATVGGFYDTYTLYGSTVNTQNSLSPSIIDQPDRTGAHLEAHTDVQTHGDIALGLNGNVSGTEYETDVFTGTPSNDSLLTERRIELGGDLRIPVGSAQGQVDVMFTTAGLGAEGRFEDDLTTLDGGLSAQLLTRPGLHVHVGGRFLAASIGPEASSTSTERRSARFLAPSFEIDWTANDAVSFFLQNQPGVTSHSLADLLQENPYLFGNTGVQPSLRTTDAEGGVRVFSGPLQLVARAGYQYTVNHQYITNAAATAPTPNRPLYVAGTFSTQYASARIVHTGVEVSLQRMAGVEVSVGATYRNGQLVGPDVAIPYFAPFTGYTVVSYAFADQKGLIQLTGRAESARYVDLTETTQVDPYVDLDLEASFDVTSSLALLFGIENMTGTAPERWDRYPQPPLVFTSGIRVQW